MAPLLTNDQKIMAYQRVIAGDNRRKIAETRRKLPAMNIVQTLKKRPYDTPPIYDRPQLANLSAQPYNTGISVGSALAAQS